MTTKAFAFFAAFLFAAVAHGQPTPPGGGWGIHNPAGPYNLANKCLYFDQANDSDTKLCRTGANEVTLTVGNVAELVCDASYCTFASGPKIGASIPFADVTGTLTLQNVDALDSTSETTIEGAIDTLANLTSVQGQTVSLAGAVTVEVGGLVANQDLTTDANPGFASVTVGNTGLHVLDTNASHDLILKPGSDITTADKTLTITTGDSDRGVSLSGDLTVETGGCTCNQDVTSDATPSFGSMTLGSATADCGSFTMIRGAQTGDPQVQISVSADGVGTTTLATSGGSNGDFQLTPSGGDVHLTGSFDASATVSAEQLTSTDDASVADQLTLKRSLYTVPATNTVAANAASINLANGDLQIVDLQGATGTVTVTVSNPSTGAWMVKVIQGTQLGTITWSPVMNWPGGTTPTITGTNDAVDMVTCMWDGSEHYCTIGQDVK